MSFAVPAPNPAAQRSPGNAETAQLRDATGHRLPRQGTLCASVIRNSASNSANEP